MRIQLDIEYLIIKRKINSLKGEKTTILKRIKNKKSLLNN